MPKREKGSDESKAPEANEAKGTEEAKASDDESAQALLSEIADTASEKGKQEAEEVGVEQTIPAIKRGIQLINYSAGYYIAFGVVYAGRLFLELLPDGGAMKRGMLDGADAASETFDRHKSAAANKRAKTVEAANDASEAVTA